MGIKTIYELIQDFYPGLIVLNKHLQKLFFNDLDISKGRLTPVKWFQSYEFQGCNCSLFLYFNHNTDCTGVFMMDYDFRLSDSAILSLYKHNIKIQYKDSKGYNTNVFGMVTYNRVDIIRRYTISNILDE